MGSLHLCRRQLSTQTKALSSSSTFEILRSTLHRSLYSTATQERRRDRNRRPFLNWVTLPPFTPQINASAIGKSIAGRKSTEKPAPITVVKWVRRCCPHLPVSIIEKLFRLRQVRKELVPSKEVCAEPEAKQHKTKRVTAKDTLVSGDVILLPITVNEDRPIVDSSIKKSPATETKKVSCNRTEADFVRSLVIYKDPAIVVINKPPGMPVQGGVGIRHSVDTLAGMALKYDSSEPPRLVHRLDRESSGILVLGRTQTSASILHTIFREKTSGIEHDDIENVHRALQKKYWALVIGTPRRSKGLISAPLAKIVVEEGKSERITIARDESTPSQHALTEYKVIRSAHGYSWVELRPLTGRKHQLRVHCAEALGTPIVGDYKYGWKAHKEWEPMPCLEPKTQPEKLPFGLESESGSISDDRPRLHLHCREMVLPNVAGALQRFGTSALSSSSNLDLSQIDVLELVAPVPSYMKESWEISA